MTSQERDLAALLRGHTGDSRAVAELYDRYASLVHTVASAVLRDDEAADQVVRDVWRAVWKRESHYDQRHGSVAFWLTLLARDLALDRAMAGPARGEAEQLVLSTLKRSERPAAAGPDAEQAERAREALARLTPLERQALAAALFERMGFERIAARLEVNEATVRQWIRHGLSSLRSVPMEVRT